MIVSITSPSFEVPRGIPVDAIFLPEMFFFRSYPGDTLSIVLN